MICGVFFKFRVANSELTRIRPSRKTGSRFDPVKTIRRQLRHYEIPELNFFLSKYKSQYNGEFDVREIVNLYNQTGSGLGTLCVTVAIIQQPRSRNSFAQLENQFLPAAWILVAAPIYRKANVAFQFVWHSVTECLNTLYEQQNLNIFTRWNVRWAAYVC